ncbi:hypothetical protein [Actinophytocola sp.]|uniref:hypothetical protein n=1 Tax=Actinophytocola sp. TaxID=1872138 RepID=UPI002ED61A11
MTGRTTAVVASVHVLLAAVVGLCVVALPEPADQHVTVSDPDPRLPADESLVLVRPSGLLIMNSTFTKHGDSPAVLGKPEAEALTGAGVVQVKAFVARDEGTTRGVWQMAVRDGVDPRAALRAIDRLYADGGWTREPAATRGVVVRAQAPTDGQPYASYRAHYVRGPFLVRIEAYGTDQAEVDRAFDALARQQLAAWPPR